MAFSVSKSIIATLIGAAIQDGLIESVDQPITAFVPELSANGFDGVKLWHLLTMRSGSNYVENDNPFGEHVIFNYTPDLEEEILKLEAELPPAMEWRYKSGDNALLVLALTRALTPRTLTDYTQEKLWNPLGAEYGGGWSLDDEGGLERSWCCLAATARDFAKLGRLYLNNGEWNGKRILPDNWVELSTQIDGVPPEYWDPDFAAIGVRSYGYQWWLLSEDQGDFMAFGKDGQFIYINPSAQVIIVRLGWSMGEMRLSDWVELFQTVAAETG
jgi:CubicO group peptidase (beta-lactamase class C family)